jgi:hypothetical protein
MASKTALQKHLERFRLPAHSNASFVSLRQEWALPLTDYGCIFRIKTSMPYIVSPLSLAPLHIGSITPDPQKPWCALKINLYPGVERIGIAESEHCALREEFYKAGYALCGDAQDDCGYIPETLTPRTKFLPVLIDVTDLRDHPFHPTPSLLETLCHLSESCAEALRLIRPLSKRLEQAQKNLYGDLSRKCAEMVNARTESERDENACIFWESMRAAAQPTADGTPRRLAAGWIIPSIHGFHFKAEEKRQIVNDAACAYAKKLHEDSFHARILEM